MRRYLPLSIGDMFDQCLVQVAAGESVETCLRRHPAFADELRLLLTRAEEDVFLHRALCKLTPEQRIVLALRCFGDRTVSQIARLLNQSEAWVEHIQQLAIRGLAQLLGDTEGEARQYGA